MQHNHSVSQLEAQKEREGAWVDAGAAAFMARLADADPTMTPAGKGIIKAASAAFQARLARFSDEQAAAPKGMQSPTYRVILLLGVPHVAGVALHAAVAATTRNGGTRDPTEKTALRQGSALATALEADLRFRAWRKDAQGTERRAVERMRERMKGDPKTWRTRVKQLRELADIEWDSSTLARVGMDILGLLAEAAPGVFETETVHYGHKTFLLFKLTEETSARLAADTAAMSVTRPKVGMMLVPPRAWRYREDA